MSKLREQVREINGEIESPPEDDLKPYVIFTQLAPNGPHPYRARHEPARMFGKRRNEP